jgi:hypothetical protein
MEAESHPVACMFTPLIAMTSEALVHLGQSHLAALVQSEETAGLARTFKPVLVALEQADLATGYAELELLNPQVDQVRAELAMGEAILQLAALARGPGGETAAAHAKLFPNGIEAELPLDQGFDLASVIILRERLATEPAAVDLKAQFLSDLDRAIAALRVAVAARETAEAKVDQARAVESAARKLFFAAYEADASAIARLFPGDRRRQDLYFERWEHDRPLMPPDELQRWPPLTRKCQAKPS